jgi:hypothetical protein
MYKMRMRCARARVGMAIDSVCFTMTQDEDNMREALRFSAAMLSELRTSQLSPQKYYELYMLVFDQLVNLEVSKSFKAGQL